MYLGKETAQNPSICIFHIVKIMKQYNAIPHTKKPLHFVDSLTLILLGIGLQSKQLIKYLTFCLPLPCLRILWLIEPLLIRKLSINYFEIHKGLLDDIMHDLYIFLIIQLIFIFDLTYVSTGPSLALTCNNYL